VTRRVAVRRLLCFLNLQAIETFKECGKKDSKIAGTAATNLSFVLFLVCRTFHWDKWTTLSPDKD